MAVLHTYLSVQLLAPMAFGGRLTYCWPSDALVGASPNEAESPPVSCGIVFQIVANFQHKQTISPGFEYFPPSRL